MAKPTGSTCNLDCTYCFYLEKHKLYPGKSQQFMDDITLDNYIRQHIEAQPGELVEFAWQGGGTDTGRACFLSTSSCFAAKVRKGKADPK